MPLYKLFTKVIYYFYNSIYYFINKNKEVGDFVSTDEVLATLETEKTTVELRSENNGKITKYFVKESEEIDVDTDFVEIDTSAKDDSINDKKIDNKNKEESESKEHQKQSKKEVDNNVSLKSEQKNTNNTDNKNQETSNSSKLSSDLKSNKSIEKNNSTSKNNESNNTNYQFSRGEKIVPLNKMRQTIAKRLKNSQNEYATLTTFNECDMSSAMELRTKYQEEFQKKYDIKLGFMSFFLKASTIALQEYPAVNSVIQGDNIIYRNYIDISVAVASPTGLLVPVIRNCSSMNFADFEINLNQLGKKARDGKIAIEDMQGGTFTVSNGGVYGSMFGTPIINPPQTAILGMHNIVNRPVVRDNQIVARPIMYLALSYDHRMIDGREAVLFLKKIKDLVESPEKLLFEL